MGLTEVDKMNWKRVFLFGVGLGITGTLITVLGSLGGQAGLDAAEPIVLTISAITFIALGCFQQRRPWLHALVVSVISYLLGDGLSRLFVPALRQPMGEALGGLVVFVLLASALTAAGGWLRKRILSESSSR